MLIIKEFVFITTITFHYFIVSTNDVHANQSKVVVILDWPTPKTSMDGCLSNINSSKFSSLFFNPLQCLKDRAFQWSKEA